MNDSVQKFPVARKVSTVEGWTLREYNAVSSTNLIAADLPAWNAVRADAQTAGRGRFQRNWISDEGGLWLSAVVPSEIKTPHNLPVAAGLAVFDALQLLGVQRLRMRWPNDLLVDDRKLCGLLVDQFKPELAVVGIGINVSNKPEARDETLANHTTRLADLISVSPDLRELSLLILRHLRTVVDHLQAGGFVSLSPRLKQLWGSPRRIELDLDGVLRTGLFNGVDEQGRLILSNGTGRTASYAAHQVTHLTELP